MICSRCDAVIAVPAGKEADLEQFIRGFDATLKNEYAGCDAGVTLECAKTEAASAVSAETTSVMLHTLLALPQGVEAMNVDFPGLVQTSLNLGVMHLTEDGLHFSYSIPLLHRLAEAMLAQRVHAIVEFAAARSPSAAIIPAGSTNAIPSSASWCLASTATSPARRPSSRRRTADWSAGSSLRRFPVSTHLPRARAARRSFRARAAERALHRARLRAGVRGPAPQQVSRKPCGYK